MQQIYQLPVVCFIIIFLLNTRPAAGQSADSTHKGKLTISGYLDAYYGFNFSQPDDGNNPYFVSMNRHNEATINLAMIDIGYQAERVRARLAPGFGTYINANYVAEPATLRNLVEASVGVRLFKNKAIWVDFGVLSSPYTNESAISRDHLMYTCSFAPEYVPYYLSGAKLSVPLSDKITGSLYLLNGWQQIQDQNSGKSLGTQIEYRPNAKNLFNWNTYLGDERSDLAPDNRMRYFTDVYWIHNPDGKFTITSCAYIGLQRRIDPAGYTGNYTWWQANAIARYRFNDRVSLSGRIEYFNDPDTVQISPVTGQMPFTSYSSGLCLNVKITDNAMFRLEGRQFSSDQEVYLRENNTPTNRSTWLISNLTV